MLLAYSLPDKQQGFLFIIVGCVAIILLLILWFVLQQYYKKSKDANLEVENITEEQQEVLDVLTDSIDNESLVEEVTEYTEETTETLCEETIASESVATETVEEIPVSEHVELKDEPSVNIPLTVDLNGNYDDTSYDITPIIRYKKSFIAKLILNKDLQPIYEEVRDHIMSYKKVKSRLSFKYERFSIGRQVLVKMLVRGKKLYLYLALDPNLQEAKYHIQDVSNKRIGRELPSLLKVLSPRSIKYAKQLIDKLMEENEIALMNPDRIVRIDYKDLLRRRSLEQLIKDGLIIEYQMKGSFLNKVSSDYLTDEEIKAITPDEADKLVSDELLNNVVKTKKVKRSGKIDIVNIDALNDSFEDGDYVDLEAMIEVGLISKQARRVKVLARGKLEKKLTVEADAFSKQAMKMIVYKGGEVILLK